MARTVDEIMNAELAYARPESKDDVIRELILAYGITAVPILDGDHRPVGVVSLRDLIDPAKRDRRMSAPAVTIAKTATLDEAATIFCESGLHHLVVVDEKGVAVGMVSLIDVLRALRGAMTSHPKTFPRRDPKLGISWSHEGPLDADHVASMSTYAGIVILSYGEAHVREVPVWVEASSNVRLRLEDMLSLPQDSPRLRELLAAGNLRFRTARVEDPSHRAAIVARVTDELDHLPLPQAKALAG